MTQDHSTFVEFDECRLHMLRGGAGVPVVFLHGASGGGTWLPFMEELSKTYDVHAPEHPGFGRSDDPPWLDTVSDLAYFYLDYLARLKVDQVHLIGTSLGGWIAAEMAVRSTRHIGSLTLVCAVGILADGQPIEDVFRLPPDEHVARFCHGSANAEKRRREGPVLTLTINRPERRNAMTWDVIAGLRRELAAADPVVQGRNRATVARLGWRPRFHNSDLHKWLHRIDRPTQIVWGESDLIVPLSFGTAWRKLVPGASLAVIPETGHAPYIEEPSRFVETVRPLFERVDGISPTRS